MQPNDSGNDLDKVQVDLGTPRPLSSVKAVTEAPGVTAWKDPVPSPMSPTHNGPLVTPPLPLMEPQPRCQDLPSQNCPASPCRCQELSQGFHRIWSLPVPLPDLWRPGYCCAPWFKHGHGCVIPGKPLGLSFLIYSMGLTKNPSLVEGTYGLRETNSTEHAVIDLLSATVTGCRAEQKRKNFETKWVHRDCLSVRTPWHMCGRHFGGAGALLLPPGFGELITDMARPFPCWEEEQRGQSQGRGWLAQRGPCQLSQVSLLETGPPAGLTPGGGGGDSL